MLCGLERPFAMLSISSTLRNSEGRSERLAQNNSKIGGAQGGEQRKKENLILSNNDVVSKREIKRNQEAERILITMTQARGCGDNL